MQILADENIPFAGKLCSRLGEVRMLPGRQITPAAVREADALLVRSVTRVGAELLAESRVRFVGTATIGTDHIDLAWLRERGIGFAAAPGSNAESVAQYVAAALAWTAGRLGRPLSRCSLGVVGVGHCGRRVERIARALGLRVLLNDPPLARQTGDPQYRPLDELHACDFLTLHVPLTSGGADPTRQLINGAWLDRARPEMVLLNASRGGVVDERALLERIEAGRLAGAALDTWEGEPRINQRLLGRALLGTPHIAGYSFDGKAAGARMIYKALAAHLGRPVEQIQLDLPPAAVARIEPATAGRSFDAVAAELILTAYPIWRDDAELRTCITEDRESSGEGFDRLRRLYPTRREFAATDVLLKTAPADWAERIAALGFNVIQ